MSQFPINAFKNIKLKKKIEYYFALESLLSTSSQLTTFHQAAI
jgi:hypothetical protein